jgi:hypothetical protein
LFIVGALALVLGVAAVGFGIPVSEFSFGNTLIIAGATAATGGLVVIALGAAVSQLQRLNDALAQPMAAHAHEPFAAAAPAAPEPHPFEPRGPSLPPEFPMPASPAPMLRNPDEPPEVADEIPLSPPPAAAEAETKARSEQPREVPAWMRQRSASQPVKEEPKSSSFFDSMWPPENKMFGRMENEAMPAPAEPSAPAEPPAVEPRPAMAASVSAEPSAAEPEEKPRAVAILKSGVVDGMGYTLYVDGSIEAELPQGTLRFASIHELRAHLEQNG